MPGLRIFLDTGNTYLIGERPIPAYEAGAAYTIGTHFKDHRVAPVPSPLGFDIKGAVANDTFTVSIGSDGAPFNQTGIGALELAEESYAALVHWHPPVDGAALLSPEKNAIRELNLIGKLEDEADEDLFGFDVNFSSKIALPPRIDP